MSLWRWYCSLLKPPSEKATQRWRAMKSKGKKSFALRVGVLQWGGLMFVAVTATDLIGKPRRSSIHYAIDIAVNLLIWPIAGYFFGRTMWNFYETYFGESQPRNSSNPSGSK